MVDHNHMGAPVREVFNPQVLGLFREPVAKGGSAVVSPIDERSVTESA